MIVIDSSALIAIIYGEPEALAMMHILEEASSCVIGAPTLFESRMVAEGRSGTRAIADLAETVEVFQIDCRPWESHHATIAHEAFLRFGKGRNPASLNFGDCMAYALAKALDVPLLFKGKDFALTDIRSAL